MRERPCISRKPLARGFEAIQTQPQASNLVLLKFLKSAETNRIVPKLVRVIAELESISAGEAAAR